MRDTNEQTLQRSDATLRRRACALCDQSLLQAKRGHCGAIWERESCYWVKAFATAPTRGRTEEGE